MDTSTGTHQTADLVEEGIAALISGRKAQARMLLGQALETNPHSEKGWLWLSGAVESDEERRFCLLQVLSINERSPAAQKGLRELGLGPARSPLARSVAAAEPEPRPIAVEPEPVTTPAELESPAGEAPAWSQWRPEADSAAATESSVPKTWLIVAAILAAGIIMGLALLFVINAGILGK